MTDYLDVRYKDDNGIIYAKVGFFPGVRDEIPDGYSLAPGKGLDGKLKDVVGNEFDDDLRSSVLKLAKKYGGVESEVLEILKAASEQDSFEEYSERLRKGSKFVGKIGEGHRHAHTYVRDFLDGMKGELGLIDDYWANGSKDVAEYGPGLVFLPDS